MFDWVVVSLLGLAFIGLVISWVATWMESDEIDTLALLCAVIAFGAIFIFTGVWSCIFANGIGARITGVVFGIGGGLFYIVHQIGRIYDE